jgi:class 3 adenylate cyclase
MRERLFQFEDFELDGVAFELRCAGHLVHLERIPTELLLLLAERWGQLVTRDEILERIWGKHVFIDATNAINTAVRKIRQALKDPANAPRFLITVPRKGYRFAAARCQSAGQQAVITDVAFEPAGRALVAEKQSGRSAERRRLTALFCDLENSASVAAAQDPEDGRELFASFRRAATECIERFGGSIAQQLTDGVRSYFGWPEAHDNDAERAVRASLAIIDAASKLDERLQRPQLAPRIAIHTGLVVVNGRDGKDVDVFGTVPIIAARVLETATGGTVLATAETCRLLSAQFVVEHRGAQTFNGGGPPIQLYRLTKPDAALGRLKIGSGRQLTPFVGREEELRLLLSRWERTREGEGQLALVVGEAGIGKSRLVAEFHDRIRESPHIWMESAGEQFFENSPFHALTEMLSQWLELQGGANTDEMLARLERALASAGQILAVAQQRCQHLISALSAQWVEPQLRIVSLAIPLM